VADRTCPTCGRTFEGVRGRRFCSERCWPSRRERFLPEGAVPEDAPPTRETIVGLAWASARRGSVPAMRLLLEELKGGRGPTGSTTIDELAKRRRQS
jgi:hypothetical protein